MTCLSLGLSPLATFCPSHPGSSFCHSAGGPLFSHESLLTSSKQLSYTARGCQCHPKRKEQNSFGNLSLKVATFPIRKKLVWQSYLGDASEPSPENWAALEKAIQFQEKEETRLFFCGPAVGDLAEIEAFCRLYRQAEHLHSSIMDALRSYNTTDTITMRPDQWDVLLVEEKVASGVAHLMSLLHEGKSEFLGSRKTGTGDLMEETSPDELPPFARFRKNIRECCKPLEETLESLLPVNSKQGMATRRRMQKLKNTCLDAGFPRPDGIPSHADIPNLAPVRLWPSNSARTLYKDEDVAFWRGGQITEIGLEWLIDKGFKLIVDLREESAQSIAQSFLSNAVASGKLKVVKIPVESGSFPSKEQVEEFVQLVADAANKPLYLQTQAGVGRASRMVSRWREIVLQQQLQNGKETKEGINEILAHKVDLVIVEDVVRISQEDASALEIASRGSEKGNFSTSLVSDSEKASYEEITVPLELKHASTAGVEVFTSADTFRGTQSERWVPANVDGSVQNHFSSFNLTNNAFEAQRPVPNALSKKAIAKFMNGRKVPAVLFTQRVCKETCKSSSASNSTESLINRNIVGPANRWGLASSGIPGPDTGKVGQQQKIEVKKQQQVDISSSSPENGGYDEATVESNSGVGDVLVNGNVSSVGVISRNEEQEKEESGDLSVSPTRGTGGPFFRVPAAQGVTDEGDEEVHADGDMCASKTGVVRLQSRKKAEMFLVRTDGYSCTREQVKESTLAFTHPSTQQQMLMWKTPPRTVMLLKKLGNELMCQTQEVFSAPYDSKDLNHLTQTEKNDGKQLNI